MSHTESTSRAQRVLLIDDDKSVHISLKYILRPKYECVSAYTAEEAVVVLSTAKTSFSFVILDMNMSVENEGISLLPRIHALSPDLDVIVASGNTNIDLVGQAITAGAAAWLVKDFSGQQLLFTIESLLKRRELIKENQHHKRNRERTLTQAPLIGRSAAMLALAQTINKVKKSNANVLITGETGTGKELVAKHIGAFDSRPFVAIDSAIISGSMAESLLFGHEKGAFTGAMTSTKGLFEEADGGVVYFDEIANMSTDIQSKLLRVIQEKEISRVGSRKVIPLDFKVISATNVDLDAAVNNGSFKFDLLQRLNVIPVHVPPLRERREDIPELLQHFLKLHSAGQCPSCFSSDALDVLTSYNWPGNVRELSNVVAYLCAMIDDREAIEVEDLPAKMIQELRKSVVQTEFEEKNLSNVADNFVHLLESTGEADFYAYIHGLEGHILTILYKKFSGNLSKLSKSIRVSRSHLYSKLNAHGLNKQ